MTANAFPEFGRILAGVARIADVLPGPDNDTRRRLRAVAVGFEAAHGPSFLAAKHELGHAMLERLYAGRLVDEPETWLVCACVTLLAHEQVRLADGVERATARAIPIPTLKGG
jgi:hypothetical protein